MKVLSTKKIGVVAHFYMDPQVQGVLTSASQRWPNIHISDSLVMADSAVSQAEAGCQAIAVLGVDFMSENVRAILDESGYTDVKVRCSHQDHDEAIFVLVSAMICSFNVNNAAKRVPQKVASIGITRTACMLHLDFH